MLSHSKGELLFLCTGEQEAEREGECERVRERERALEWGDLRIGEVWVHSISLQFTQNQMQR